jgi:hypothetical protein
MVLAFLAIRMKIQAQVAQRLPMISATWSYFSEIRENSQNGFWEEKGCD